MGMSLSTKFGIVSMLCAMGIIAYTAPFIISEFLYKDLSKIETTLFAIAMTMVVIGLIGIPIGIKKVIDFEKNRLKTP